jgi:hypothetical protein
MRSTLLYPKVVLAMFATIALCTPANAGGGRCRARTCPPRCHAPLIVYWVAPCDAQVTSQNQQENPTWEPKNKYEAELGAEPEEALDLPELPLLKP